jgi:uncharacterized protein YggE
MADDEVNSGRHPSRAVTAAVVVAVALGGSALGVALTRSDQATRSLATCSGSTPKLTVQGSGTAMVAPDLLTIVVNIDANAPSATMALGDDDLKVTGALAAFKSGGVAGKDIQTSGLSLQPQYSYPKGVPTVTGYQVTNSVTATLRKIGSAGAVIDAVVGSAGNAVQIQSLTFSSSNPGAVEDRARSQAVTQAVRHAKVMALAAGRSLGPVCSLTDQSTVPSVFGDNGALPSGLAEAAGTTSGSVPIVAGTQSETAQITLVYALEQARTTTKH